MAGQGPPYAHQMVADMRRNRPAANTMSATVTAINASSGDHGSELPKARTA